MAEVTSFTVDDCEAVITASINVPSEVLLAGGDVSPLLNSAVHDVAVAISALLPAGASVSVTAELQGGIAVSTAVPEA